MIVKPIKTRIFKESENLARFIFEHVPKMKEGSVLVITSKIVALSEGRTAPLGSLKDKEQLIRKESEVMTKSPYAWITLKDGILLSNAGIDESNANGRIIFLPKDSYRAAARVRAALVRKYRVRNLGVVITDSRTMPLRSGTIGIAVGYAGFKGLRDYRKTPDIFGRLFKVSRANIADGLSATGVLVMGEGAEQTPLVVIENARIEFSNAPAKNELSILPEDDMYQPYLRVPRPKKKR